jgi:hypothetical protein
MSQNNEYVIIRWWWSLISWIRGGIINYGTPSKDNYLVCLIWYHRRDKKSYVRFEVLTVVVMTRSIIWDVTPCSPLKVIRRFGGACHLHLQGQRISQAINQRENRWQTLLSRCFLVWLILRPWRWRRHAPPKRRLTFNWLHGVISQKTDLFITIITIM